jgi:large subunit ribosomal protein L19
VTNLIIEDYESKYNLKKKPQFKIGDTISVHLRIIEGEKERIQVFTGVVISKKGRGSSETFSLYRMAYGCNMERVFLLNSPTIAKVEVSRSHKVRKSKLFYLRKATGKGAKLKEQFMEKEKPSEAESIEVKDVSST